MVKVEQLIFCRIYNGVGLYLVWGVVGWCEGVMYLMSPGRPTDIDLQLDKACYPYSR